MPAALLADFNEHFKLREPDYRLAAQETGRSRKDEKIIELPPNVCFLRPTFENLLAANGIMSAILAGRERRVRIYSTNAVSILNSIWVKWNKKTEEDERVRLLKPEDLSKLTSE